MSYQPSLFSQPHQLQQQQQQQNQLFYTNGSASSDDQVLYEQLWHDLFNASSAQRPAVTHLITEFIRTLGLNRNILQTSMPSIILSGISLLELSARSFAPTRDLLQYVQQFQRLFCCFLTNFFNVFF